MDKRYKLTQKQENFALNIFKGMTQYDSYLTAGYSSNCSRAILDTNASMLANSNKIMIRLKELRSEIKSEALADVQERKEILTEIARAEMKAPVTARERVMAVTEFNKMDKVYEQPPEKGDIVQTFVFVLPDGTKVLPRQLKEGHE